jgi:hypothetical protein
MTCVRVLLFGLVWLATQTLGAENYIVPIWSSNLSGSDGSWWAQATATNPNGFPVSFRVARVFPLQTVPCSVCTGEGSEVTLEPYASTVIHPPSGVPFQRLIAGAFEVTSTAPLNIHLVAYRPGANEIRQRLDVARRWLSPGIHFVSTVERGAAWRINVFVTNPGDAPLNVSVWTRSRALNEVRATIGPRATHVISLPPPDCGAGPSSCPPPTTEYPPFPLRIEIEADGQYLASVSSLDPRWAVFSIADEALQ